MFLYKYLKKEYLKQFEEKGKVCVGNIYWYRDIENARIKDPFEGRTKYVIDTEQELWSFLKNKSMQLRMTIIYQRH